jgi:hypothetical protein
MGAKYPNFFAGFRSKGTFAKKDNPVEASETRGTTALVY